MALFSSEHVIQNRESMSPVGIFESRTHPVFNQSSFKAVRQPPFHPDGVFFANTGIYFQTTVFYIVN